MLAGQAMVRIGGAEGAAERREQRSGGSSGAEGAAERREQRNGGGLTGGAAGSGRTVLWGWAGEAEPAALTLSLHSLSPGRAAHTAQTGSEFLLFRTEGPACLAVGIGTLRPAGRLAAAPRPHGTRADNRTK